MPSRYRYNRDPSRRFRHEEFASKPEGLQGVGKGRPMIPGGRCNEELLRIFSREREDLVHHTTKLERPAFLGVFEFEKHFGTAALAESSGSPALGSVDVGFNSPMSFGNRNPHGASIVTRAYCTISSSFIQ